MGFLDRVIKKEKPVPKDLMLSQYAALYCGEQNDGARSAYLSCLKKLGLTAQQAQAMFDFDCSVVQKHPKQYLLRPDFVKLWFFGLRQPFFLEYPKEKPDILKERFFTVSEICKIIDEAEWHFWNSHERALSDPVWAEICAWRLNGPGAKFAIQYFEMISASAGIPMEQIAKISSGQGEFLKNRKWH